MEQIKDEKELIGKTIVDIKYTVLGEKTVLFFSDEKYAVYEIDKHYHSEDDEISLYTDLFDEKEELYSIG